MNLNLSANRFMRIAVIGLVLMLALGLIGCAGPNEPAAPAAEGAASYIATMTGAPASARVGLVLEGSNFVVYVCSLDDTFNLTSARWYEGELAADGKTITGTSTDGVTLNATVEGDVFAGTIVNTEGTSLPFSGSVVAAGGPTGLYRGFAQYGGQDIVIGAVVSADGSFASTVQYKGRFEFVTPVAGEPQRLSDQSINVTIGSDAIQVPAQLVTTLASDSGG